MFPYCYRAALILILWIAAFTAAQAIDTYTFATPQLQQRFYALNDELRCPKCQNQNLAGSNAPIAIDLRAQVYRLLNEGKTDREIKDYLVERYGEYVLYRPEWSPRTYLLWLAPAVFLLIGLVLVIGIVRRTRGATQTGVQEISSTEREQLEQMLGNDATTRPEDDSRD